MEKTNTSTTTMSRWHIPDCQAPLVVLGADGQPRCDACQASFAPSPEALNSDTADIPSIPPDEASGHLALYWPHTVRYKPEQYRPSPHEDPLVLPDNDPSFSAPKNDKGKEAATEGEPGRSASIYQPRLRQHEIRLLRIRPAEDGAHGHAIHVDLEVYDLDRCPEYETMSYTWGGEEGDSRHVLPIFVGAHWDALWQTANCCAMLRYLRPSEDSRLVWIDAVCINQRDTLERGQQVALMAHIYKKAWRAVVYLGEHIAQRTPGTHPRRQKLEDSLATDATHDSTDNSLCRGTSVFLDRLLRLKYFGRAWVIQELVFSSQITIPLSDLEITADALTPSALAKRLPNWKWEKTDAPWFQYIAQRQIPEVDVFRLAQVTRRSRSTDPRDRFFAVHALLAGPEQVFQADYSLSRLHLCIGVFAHFIVNMKHVAFLGKAAGMAAWESRYPSWMPECGSHTSWQRLLQEEDRRPAKSEEADLFRQAWIAWPKAFTRKSQSLCEVTAQSGGRPPADNRLQFGQWEDGAWIDSATGALLINLVHLCQFPAVPTRIGERLGGTGGSMFEIFLPRRSTSMYLVTDEFDLGTIQPETDHLFVLDQRNESCLFFVLREAGGKIGSLSTFRLVTGCSQVWFGGESSPYPPGSVRRHYEQLLLDDLRRTLFSALSERYSERRRDPWNFASDEELCNRLFPGLAYEDSLLEEASQGLINERRHVKPGLLESYARAFGDSVAVRVRGKDWVELTIPPEKWEQMHEDRFLPAYRKVFKRSRFVDGENGRTSWSKLGLTHHALFRRGRTVCVLADIDDIAASINDTLVYRNMGSLSHIAKLTSEPEIALYRRWARPNLRDNDVAIPAWPWSIRDAGFGIDGNTWKVPIL